jgi:hypothetical protein
MQEKLADMVVYYNLKESIFFSPKGLQTLQVLRRDQGPEQNLKNRQALWF